MNSNQFAALTNLDLAEKAFKRGEKDVARQFAVQAAELAPELEDVWLVMATLAAPRASLKFFQEALKINPNSLPAQQGLAAAQEKLGMARLQKAAEPQATVVPVGQVPEPVNTKSDMAPLTVSAIDPEPETSAPENAGKRRRIFFVVLLLLVICLIGALVTARLIVPGSERFYPLSNMFFVAQTDVSTTSSPAFPASALNSTAAQAASAAEILPVSSSPTPGFPPTETYMPAASPTASMASVGPFTASPTPGFPHTETSMPVASPAVSMASVGTFTASPTLSARPSLPPSETATPTFVPSDTPTEQASPTALPSDTPEPTPAALPTQQAAQTTNAGVQSGSASSGGKHWIDVDLTNQMVYAYEGDTIVNSFLVSTGAAPRLTVTGSFHIYERYIKANMWGPGYFLPDVPYTMYFYKGFALHGTYWHANFGTPMSHGCVNLSIPDAEWLYYWSTWGTLVKVHY